MDGINSNDDDAPVVTPNYGDGLNSPSLSLSGYWLSSDQGVPLTPNDGTPILGQSDSNATHQQFDGSNSTSLRSTGSGQGAAVEPPTTKAAGQRTVRGFIPMQLQREGEVIGTIEKIVFEGDDEGDEEGWYVETKVQDYVSGDFKGFRLVFSKQTNPELRAALGGALRDLRYPKDRITNKVLKSRAPNSGTLVQVNWADYNMEAIPLHQEEGQGKTSAKKRKVQNPAIAGLEEIASLFRAKEAQVKALRKHMTECSKKFPSTDASNSWLTKLQPILKKEWFYGYLNPDQCDRAANALRKATKKHPGRFFCRLSCDYPRELTCVTGANGIVEEKRIGAADLDTFLKGLAEANGFSRRESTVMYYFNN